MVSIARQGYEARHCWKDVIQTIYAMVFGWHRKGIRVGYGPSGGLESEMQLDSAANMHAPASLIERQGTKFLYISFRTREKYEPGYDQTHSFLLSTPHFPQGGIL